MTSFVSLCSTCMSFLRTSLARSINVSRASRTSIAPLRQPILAAGLFSPLAFFSSTPPADMSQPKVTKSDSEWQAILSPEQVSGAGFESVQS